MKLSIAASLSTDSCPPGGGPNGASAADAGALLKIAPSSASKITEMRVISIATLLHCCTPIQMTDLFGSSFRAGALSSGLPEFGAPDPESRDSGFDAGASPRNDGPHEYGLISFCCSAEWCTRRSLKVRTFAER